MRATRVILLSFVGMVVASPSVALTHVDARYGFFPLSPPLNNTLRTDNIIEQGDLDYWDPDFVDARNAFWREGSPQNVTNSDYTFDPPQAGIFSRHLQFPSGGSPLPPEWVGMWKLQASMALMILFCDSTQIPIQCYHYPVCNSQNMEPCFDEAEGYID